MGTMIYEEDKHELTGASKFAGYLPHVTGPDGGSWPDESGTKKSGIGFEYSQQQLRQKNADRKGVPLPSPKENPLIMRFRSKPDSKMDFAGRVTAASRKNFQLLDDSESDPYL